MTFTAEQVRHMAETHAAIGHLDSADMLDAFAAMLEREATREEVANKLWDTFCPGIRRTDSDNEQYLENADSLLAKYHIILKDKVTK